MKALSTILSLQFYSVLVNNFNYLVILNEEKLFDKPLLSKNMYSFVQGRIPSDLRLCDILKSVVLRFCQVTLL